MPIVIEHGVSAGAAAPLHLHHDLEDNSYLVSGQLALRCGEDTFVARAGDYVVLPRAIPHTLRVIGDDEAVMLHTHADTGQPVLGPSAEDTADILAAGND
jgi:uncharacterized RmlC-like cupin family protein